MTRERALALWDEHRWNVGDWLQKNSPDEYQHVTDVWDTMAGYTCWMDAFFRICAGSDSPTFCDPRTAPDEITATLRAMKAGTGDRIPKYGAIAVLKERGAETEANGHLLAARLGDGPRRDC